MLLIRAKAFLSMKSQKFIQTAIQIGKRGKKFKRDLRKTSFNGYALTEKKLL
jgi:hypothetical protein